jgi:CheY-like chemotaxis protein
LALLNRYQPDLLLADIAMPVEDGISLISKIRKLEPDEGANVPSVALTAYAGADDRKRILASGFDSYLAKPVNAAQLIRLVNQMTERLRMRAVEAG